MKPEIRDRWVAALRSGKYIQGHGALKIVKNDQAQHCCLGVLCEIAVEDGIIPKSEREYIPRETGSGSYWEQFDGRSDILPRSVKAWADLEDRNPWLAIPEEHGGLVADEILPASEWNDEYGRTFEEIADAIEYTYV